MRKHGLSIDNLQAIAMVTADGKMLRASANADMGWQDLQRLLNEDWNRGEMLLGAHGENLPGLRSIKAVYDPGYLFPGLLHISPKEKGR